MRIIDGRAIARSIGSSVTADATALRREAVTPTLAVVMPTEDPAAAWYVGSIERTAARVGVRCRVSRLEEPRAADIAGRLGELSSDPSIHGIICQTPLPDGIDLAEIASHISVDKDVDGANPVSLGRVAFGLPSFAPATAAAIIEILHHERVDLVGARVVIVGRSTVVGKPVALLALAAHATVTVCHSRTRALAEVCREADILIVAAGQVHLIGSKHVRPDAFVIDVGTNPTADGSVTGDVNSEELAACPGAITPVPGGVGPVTTMRLLRQTVDAAHRLANR